MEEKDPSMERLRSTVEQYIKIDEAVLILFKRILRRATIILVCIGFVLALGIGVSIYFLLKPAPASQVTLRYIQGEREQILKDRVQMQESRDNIYNMYKEILKQDSIIHAEKK